jgi:hypothetical protein
MAAGVAVFFAVLLPGALWYKGAQRAMAMAAARDSAKTMSVRLQALSEQVSAELEFMTSVWAQTDKAGVNQLSSKIRRDLPFDLVTTFTHDRHLIDGFRHVTGLSQAVDVGPEAVRLLFEADSGFFDRVSGSTPVSGVLTIEGRAMLVTTRRVALTQSIVSPGYILAGRWLDATKLIEHDPNVTDGFASFSLADDDKIPESLRDIVPIAQRNKGFAFEVDKNGDGALFAMLDDINGRPALIVKSSWSAPWKSVGHLGYGLFFASAVLAGVSTWISLIWSDVRNRKRKRQFDGLSSLNVDQIRILVEAFPGYAFAIKTNLEYVGVSRILAGVTGQEPSYFSGQNFGSVAAEWNDGKLAKIFLDLRDPKRWPRVASAPHVIEGLGERHEFSGTAHYLAKQELLLVILHEKQSTRMTQLPQSPQSHNHASKDSAVA